MPRACKRPLSIHGPLAPERKAARILERWRRSGFDGRAFRQRVGGHVKTSPGRSGQNRPINDLRFFPRWDLARNLIEGECNPGTAIPPDDAS